ncbi:AAA family ATPase [Pseudoduganella sp. R-31]|uniref:AAA family ATPase n=1 Tax=Pseudoduganella sp. R-31 TaxID=3404060 RepID=UPI003CEFE721
MIRIERGPAPDLFHSKPFKKLAEDANAYFAQPMSQRAQRRYDFGRVTGRFYPELRRHLQERFASKCAYCESFVEQPDIENFRPKIGASNLDGHVDEDCYWWLVFDWSNYLPACRQCNLMKGTRFPIRGVRAKPRTVRPALEREGRLLLDPCDDYPEEILLFLDDGRVTSESERGKVTIDVLSLNRGALVEARSKELRKLHLQLRLVEHEKFSAQALDELRSMISGVEQFTAMKRQFAKAWASALPRRDAWQEAALASFLEHRSALDAVESSANVDADKLIVAAMHLDEHIKQHETYTLDADTISQDFYRNARFIEKIELRNIRAIKRLTLQPAFSEQGPGSWLMLLGENGAGKSTVLQAIACALIGQKGVDSLELKAASFLRRGCARGEVRIQVSGLSAPITLSLERGSDRITVDPPDPKLMILGYGATRLLAGAVQPDDGKTHFKVRNLFDPHAPLSDGRPWLHDAPRATFNRHVRSLSTLLPRQDTATFSRRGGVVYVETPGARNSLEDLSSGYQAILALALDIMSVMRRGWDDMDGAEGVVLIDEVDAHLHPRWKMKIVPLLRRLFPRVQFIATSHEPLTLRSLNSAEVAVLRRSSDGEVTATTAADAEIPSPRFMRIEQLLKSELFGLHSTEDPIVESMFEEYYNLLAKHSLGPEERKKLASLRGDLANKRQMGSTQRERIVLQAADEFLAKREAEKATQPREKRNAALKTLKTLWADLNTGKGGLISPTEKRQRKGAA